MTITPAMARTINVSIHLTDLELEEDARDQQAHYLVRELQEMGIDSACRVADPNPPAGNKALGGFIVGLLTAEVSLSNVQLVLKFFGDRLANKTIELEVEADGKRLRVSASSQTELEKAIAAAQEFVAA